MSKVIDNFHLLSSSQRRFILNDREVLSDLVRSNMSEWRYAHSLGVAALAEELARCHHVDPEKAWRAGILHDLTKELSIEELDSYLRYYDPDKLNEPDKVKHSHVGKYYLKDKLHINDKDILNAVYNHTVLGSADRLSLIIYVADKRDRTRGIDDEVVKIARKDLKKAVETLIRKWKEKHEYKDGTYSAAD
ncbi:MAG: bis(5'-nucleosyl)-tetraphosphatase (symmetrical) YqeK [Erysipelotrichaceae bacterium]|nr:bis(5'-nucleosyl)-tetraphosphatase (symmetrical) YqeK [Erysipelotrichaceae bacterium]